MHWHFHITIHRNEEYYSLGITFFMQIDSKRLMLFIELNYLIFNGDNSKLTMWFTTIWNLILIRFHLNTLLWLPYSAQKIDAETPEKEAKDAHQKVWDGELCVNDFVDTWFQRSDGLKCSNHESISLQCLRSLSFETCVSGKPHDEIDQSEHLYHLCQHSPAALGFYWNTWQAAIESQSDSAY